MLGMFINSDCDHRLRFRHYGLSMNNGILGVNREWLIPSEGEPLDSIENIFKCGITWMFVSKNKRITGFWLWYEHRVT